MAINVAPLPPKGSYGIGGYEEFIRNLDAMIDHLLENSASDDSHDPSSNSEDVDNTFDPDSSTVTEFRTALLAMRNSLSDVV